jgi:hypothetical protein
MNSRTACSPRKWGMIGTQTKERDTRLIDSIEHASKYRSRQYEASLTVLTTRFSIWAVMTHPAAGLSIRPLR